MISAIISTYNREKYLPQVLDSIVRQTLEKDQYEIIIVNNNSTDRTEEISLNFKGEHPELNVFYCVETKQGLSYARNRGIEESNGDLVTFIDDDAFLAEDYFQKVCDFFEKNDDYVSLGSKILLHYEETIPAWENKYLNALLGWFDPGDEAFDFDKKDYPRGSNMSFRASIFDDLGGFNTNLGRVGRNLAGSEEKDVHMRIMNAGLKSRYIPDAVVYHCVPLERTKTEFIKRQGLGTGQSEWRRVKDEGGLSPIKRILSEIVKWFGSMGLFVIYGLKGQFPKGVMIMRFRYWVSKGMVQRVK